MKKNKTSSLLYWEIVLTMMITFGCQNANPVETNLIFSHPTGFYNEDFNLTINSRGEENAEIRYTIDGSIPTINSKLYKSFISTKNKNPDHISHIPTTRSPGEKRKWRSPKFIKKNALVVKAQVFSNQEPKSSIYTQTYFVDSTQKSLLPTVSISTYQNNLFDEIKGILVPGTNKELPNYDQRGLEWERPIHLTWFDRNRKKVLDQNAGLRIHGGTSRQFPLKGLRVYAREEYGKSTFNYSIFKQREFHSYQRFILRPSGHDFYLTFFRDALMQSFAQDLDLDYSEVQPVVLYINGEYWGLTNARERFDKYYIQQHHGIEQAYICDDSDLNYKKTVQFISELNTKEDIGYNKIKGLMDIENFTDYKIFESFFYRWDLGNLKPWRKTETEGQWKFILSDFDVGMGGFWSVPNPSEFNFFDYLLETDGPWSHLKGHNQNTYNNTIVLRKLLENESYEKYFISRYAYFLDEIFSSEKMLLAITTFATQIEEEIPNHIARWGYPNSYEEWQMNVENLKDFARKRPNAVRQQLEETFRKRTK